MAPGDIRAAFLRKPWHRFLAGADTPAYAVMRVTGASRSHGDIRFTTDQPDSTRQAFYMVNGPSLAENTLEGLCTALTGAGIVRYDANDGTPAVGEVWGPESGSWSIHKGQPGFIIAGGPRTLDDGSTCVVAIQFPGATSTGSVVRFRLTGTLPIGESANALLLIWNGAAYVTSGTTITVYDWWGAAAGISTRGMFAGDIGMEGMASAREDGSGYDIIWMERYANSIGFTTTSPRMGLSNSSFATIDYSFEQGVTPPLDENDELEVFDDQGLFPRALEGAHGWARLNEYLNQDEPETPYYQVWQCDQQVFMGHANLSQTMCAGDYEVTIIDFVGDSFAPFGQTPDPLPETAYNPLKLSGKNLTRVELKWDRSIVVNEGEEDEFTTEGWTIHQVEHQPANLTSEFEWDPSDGCFKWDIIEGSVQVCEEDAGSYCPPTCPAA